jgi:mannose-6-phosphate isomerase-like protein (cupin superfamily)
VRIVKKDDVKKPIRSPLGEVIYELIGASDETGATEKHSFAIITLPPGKSSAAHYHRESEETYYFLRGSARRVIDGKSFQLGPGQACLIEPYERHQIFNVSTDDVEFIAVCAPAWVADGSVFA